MNFEQMPAYILRAEAFSGPDQTSMIMDIWQGPICSCTVKLIWSNLLNQIDSIIYAAKFDIFLFDQISLINFFKNSTCSNSWNWFGEKQPVKIKIITNEEKMTKIKLQTNENKVFLINFFRKQFTTWNFTPWIENLKKVELIIGSNQWDKKKSHWFQQVKLFLLANQSFVY